MCWELMLTCLQSKAVNYLREGAWLPHLHGRKSPSPVDFGEFTLLNTE